MGISSVSVRRVKLLEGSSIEDLETAVCPTMGLVECARGVDMVNNRR